jgi:nitrate reductase gamma subunit
MTAVLYCFLYVGAVAFLAGCALRVRRYSQAPLHLRWELYPVPQGHSGQLKFMIPEILFLKNLWETNRPLWYRSFAFHLGLYLLVASGGFLFLALLLPPAVFHLLHNAYSIAGCAGLALALIGAAALLYRRMTASELRNYTTPGDLFNLALFCVTLALLLIAVLSRPSDAPGIFAVLRGAATFHTALQVPAVLTAGLMCGCVLLAYMPMTFMAHFIGKYFTYHSVRWDEAPSLPGSAMEKRMATYLAYRPTWSASHVGANGSKTWGDIATANPTTNPSKGLVK